MLENIPTLVFFTQAYWNQMGREVYGTIEHALLQMLSDGGDDVKIRLRKELLFLSCSEDYEDWLKTARQDPEMIRQVGGRFILPEHIPRLLIALEESGYGAS